MTTGGQIMRDFYFFIATSLARGGYTYQNGREGAMKEESSLATTDDDAAGGDCRLCVWVFSFRGLPLAFGFSAADFSAGLAIEATACHTERSLPLCQSCNKRNDNRAIRDHPPLQTRLVLP